jgi:hypothetical protein
MSPRGVPRPLVAIVQHHFENAPADGLLCGRYGGTPCLARVEDCSTEWRVASATTRSWWANMNGSAPNHGRLPRPGLSRAGPKNQAANVRQFTFSRDRPA